MHLFSSLWEDECGVLLSAEAVVVGTVAVVGLTTGLTVVGKSVNEELQDVAFAIRSLDQSYHIPAQSGCCAMTAGSLFQQEPVEESLDELQEEIRAAEKEFKSQADRLKHQMNNDDNTRDKRKEKNKDEKKSRKSRRDDRGI